MPAGYRFLKAFLEGPDGLDGLGTTNRRLRLNFHCMRDFQEEGAALFPGTLVLYDHSMTAVSGITAI
jgi:hypothetical protein